MEIKYAKIIKFLLLPAIFFAVFFIFGNEARAATYYVDNTTTSCSTPSDTDYDPTIDTCGAGSYTVYDTIQGAANVVSPGDTVIVADGTYTDTDSDGYVLFFNSSGSADNWITFKSENKWGAVLDGDDTAGICIGTYIHHHVIIDGFDIKRCNYGIHTNSGAHDIQVINNDIHHMAVHCDTPPKNYGGMGISTGTPVGYPIYNWTISGNKIHDLGAPVTCDYRNTSNDYGVYLNGHDMTVINNIFYNNYAGWDIHIGRSCTTETDGNNFLISNNTFSLDASSNYSGSIILFNRDDCYGTNFTNFRIQNNISYNPKSNILVYIYSDFISGIDITNNLINVGSIRTSVNPSYTPGTETGNITGQDPLFVDLANRNFHLQSGSPAINTGLSANAPAYDFDGKLRIGNPDIGAYEYVDTTPPAAPGGLTVQ